MNKKIIFITILIIIVALGIILAFFLKNQTIIQNQTNAHETISPTNLHGIWKVTEQYYLGGGRGNNWLPVPAIDPTFYDYKQFKENGKYCQTSTKITPITTNNTCFFDTNMTYTLQGRNLIIDEKDGEPLWDSTYYIELLNETAMQWVQQRPDPRYLLVGSGDPAWTNTSRIILIKYSN